MVSGYGYLHGRNFSLRGMPKIQHNFPVFVACFLMVNALLCLVIIGHQSRALFMTKGVPSPQYSAIVDRWITSGAWLKGDELVDTCGASFMPLTRTTPSPTQKYLMYFNQIPFHWGFNNKRFHLAEGLVAARVLDRKLILPSYVLTHDMTDEACLEERVEDCHRSFDVELMEERPNMFKNQPESWQRYKIPIEHIIDVPRLLASGMVELLEPESYKHAVKLLNDDEVGEIVGLSHLIPFGVTRSGHELMWEPSPVRGYVHWYEMVYDVPHFLLNFGEKLPAIDEYADSPEHILDISQSGQFGHGRKIRASTSADLLDGIELYDLVYEPSPCVSTIARRVMRQHWPSYRRTRFGPELCFHLRRGDQPSSEEALAEMFEPLRESVRLGVRDVLLLTESERTPGELEAHLPDNRTTFRQSANLFTEDMFRDFPALLIGDVRGLVEQLVCATAQKFIGSRHSSFSGGIVNIRGGSRRPYAWNFWSELDPRAFPSVRELVESHRTTPFVDTFDRSGKITHMSDLRKKCFPPSSADADGLGRNCSPLTKNRAASEQEYTGAE